MKTGMVRVIPLNVQIFSFLSYLFLQFTDFCKAVISSVEVSFFLTWKHGLTSILNSISRTELLDEILPASQDASKLSLISPPIPTPFLNHRHQLKILRSSDL